MMRSTNNLRVTLSVLVTLTYSHFTYANQRMDSTVSDRPDRMVLATHIESFLTMAQQQIHKQFTVQYQDYDPRPEKDGESHFGIGYEARQQQLRGRPGTTIGDKNGAAGNHGDTAGSNGNAGGNGGGGGGGR